jgi:1-acyl-sn-glycerol-3-phosphate acyltransferase
MIATALRRAVRLPLLIGLLFGGLFTVLVLFPFGDEAFRHGAIRRWSRMLIAACGVRADTRRADGAKTLAELPPGHLVVANHVSWIDIFVINAQCPCGFVAKAEIARWPLIGTLVARTGTLFIERGKRHAVHRMIEHIGARLQVGGRVAVFPEGTTGDGRGLLPFHANLIEGAVRCGAPVVPVGLRYLDGDGDTASQIEYIGDTTFVASAWRIIGSPSIRCEVTALHEIATGDGASRHEVAARAREAMAQALGLPLEDALPEKLRELRQSGR